MTELVPYESHAPAFTADWLLDPAEIAQRIGGTDFVPRGLRDNPAAITAALLYGQEIGLGRMASLATISVIDGRPSLSAEAQRALILAAGHAVWFEDSTATKCTACGRRRGEQQVSRITWTMDDAKRAGLAGKNNWRTYPRQMLQARASAELARAMFPDVIRGLYAAEELDGDGSTAAAEPSPDKPTATRRRRRRGEDPPTAETPRGDDQPQDPGGPGAGPTPGASPLSAVPDPGEEQVEAEAGTDDVEAIVAEFEPGPPPAEEKQLRMMFALMREAGIGGDDQRDARLAYSSRVLNRDIRTSADLTMAEASSLIVDLQSILDNTAPDSMSRQVRLFGDL